MAVDVALEKNKLRTVSPFKFLPSLSAKHEEELRKRGINREFALAAGVRTTADNELREINFRSQGECRRDRRRTP